MQLDRMSLRSAQASTAFRSKDYRKALAIYKELSESLGDHLFSVNISLCLKRLAHEEGGKEQTINGLKIEAGRPTANPPPKLVSETSVSHQLIGPDSPLHLKGSRPKWLRVAIRSGQELTIEASVTYDEAIADRLKKAILLLEGVKADGTKLAKPLGRMAKSSRYNRFYTYLPCTIGESSVVHRFKVPKEVVELQLGVCGFFLADSESITISRLCINQPKDKAGASLFSPPSKAVAEMSILGWPDHPDNRKPYVLAVMDEFTSNCFSGELNLIQPRPDNWYALLEKYQPAAVFIESAWKGNTGSWQYRVADYSHRPGLELAHLCEYAKSRKIPTIFWNKEDPVHHVKFLNAAGLVDYIFTTDSEMISSYQERTGNKNVFTLPFAAQPALHKPAPLEERRAGCCFAGSWYSNRHEHRGDSMRWLLEAAKKYKLDIYDRNFKKGVSLFPEEFQQFVKGSLPYKDLCAKYRAYRVFLNVNSVSKSPTMFSRRVFELMACGTPVVSTYAEGIENLFDSDAVWLVHSQEEADEALQTLMTDDAEWRRRSLAGIREIFAKHTYAHRLNDIFCSVGITTRIPINPAVSLLAEAHSQADLEKLHAFSRQQSYRSFKLGIACAPGLAQLEGSPSENIILLQWGQKESWLTDQQAETPLAGWLSPQHRYGEHYLRDLVNASLYEPEAGVSVCIFV